MTSHHHIPHALPHPSTSDHRRRCTTCHTRALHSDSESGSICHTHPCHIQWRAPVQARLYDVTIPSLACQLKHALPTLHSVMPTSASKKNIFTATTVTTLTDTTQYRCKPYPHDVAHLPHPKFPNSHDSRPPTSGRTNHTHIVPASPGRWLPVLSAVQLHRGGCRPLHHTAASTPGSAHTARHRCILCTRHPKTACTSDGESPIHRTPCTSDSRRRFTTCHTHALHSGSTVTRYCPTPYVGACHRYGVIMCNYLFHSPLPNPVARPGPSTPLRCHETLAGMPAEARSAHTAWRDANERQSTKAYTQPPHSPIQHSATSKHIHTSAMSH